MIDSLKNAKEMLTITLTKESGEVQEQIIKVDNSKQKQKEVENK